jgi:VWFA-related protein
MHLDRILQRAGQSDVVIYAMALFDDSTEERNPGVLKQFAAATGGESFFPDNARQATQTLQRIAEDVRRVYTIGYVPTNAARDGKIRKIRVVLNADQGKKRRVRARSSYVAPLEARDTSATDVPRWQ